jgi:hypothetical protein
MRIPYCNAKVLRLALWILILLTGATSCERDTRLVIEGTDPPKFFLSGSGTLGTLRIRGPLKQREAEGEDAYLYWTIVNKEDQERFVTEIGPIIYGQVPRGYEQAYPENGAPPPSLIQGERYNVRVATANANGIDKFFILRNGKVKVSDY